MAALMLLMMMLMLMLMLMLLMTMYEKYRRIIWLQLSWKRKWLPPVLKAAVKVCQQIPKWESGSQSCLLEILVQFTRHISNQTSTNFNEMNK